MEKEHFTQSSVIFSYLCVRISPVSLCRVYIQIVIHDTYDTGADVGHTGTHGGP